VSRDGFSIGGWRRWVDRTFPIAETAAAQERLEQSRHSGKIVLEI
jgi:NADPH:quinone reductase-like Zn-dependent oxidoreductase